MSLLVRIESFQAVELCVKSVELTCSRYYTKSHDIKSIIISLPKDMDIREDLLIAWRDNMPSIFNNYSDMLYRGLNNYTGILTKTGYILYLEVAFMRCSLRVEH